MNKKVSKNVEKVATRSVEERFMAKIRKNGRSKCWLWKGSMNRHYGQFVVDGKPQLSHRVAWTLFRGPIPKGHMVIHTGKSHPKHCQNPDHLYTSKEVKLVVGSDQPGHKLTEKRVAALLAEKNNAKKKVTIGDLANKHKTSRVLIRKMVNGEYKSGQKFDRKMVQKIVSEYNPKPFSIKEKAEREGVSAATIRSVLRGDTWKHVSTNQESKAA